MKQLKSVVQYGDTIVDALLKAIDNYNKIDGDKSVKLIETHNMFADRAVCMIVFELQDKTYIGT